MKRFAAMCLIASMIASMGSVAGYAAEADGAGQTAVYQTADSASDETEVLDVSTATDPSDSGGSAERKGISTAAGTGKLGDIR